MKNDVMLKTIGFTPFARAMHGSRGASRVSGRDGDLNRTVRFAFTTAKRKVASFWLSDKANQGRLPTSPDHSAQSSSG
jgi:hypothetical protein